MDRKSRLDQVFNRALGATITSVQKDKQNPFFLKNLFTPNDDTIRNHLLSSLSTLENDIQVSGKSSLCHVST